MTLSRGGYRAAMRRHPAGVAVITLASSVGPVGFTATSFCSVSLEPALVSFNITHTSSSVAALRAAPSFVVHLLGAHQLGVAQRFSRSAAERFSDENAWALLETGEPMLVGTPTWLRASLVEMIPAGDSSLVIGRVEHIHCDESNGVPEPLLYHNGEYRCATSIPDNRLSSGR